MSLAYKRTHHRIGLVFYILVFVLCLVVVQAGQEKNQREALRKLATSLQSAYLTKQWAKTTSVCTWQHIRCDIFGSVVEIQLAGVNFEGANFGQLDFSPLQTLQKINMQSCRLVGHLSHSLNSLSNLLYLNLANNNLSGSLQHISCISQKVKIINLQKNSLVGHIPPSWENLVNLNQLDISSNWGLTGQLPNFGGFWQQLFHLGVSKTGLCGEVPPSFYQINSLYSLDISASKLCVPEPSQQMVAFIHTDGNPSHVECPLQRCDQYKGHRQTAADCLRAWSTFPASQFRSLLSIPASDLQAADGDVETVVQGLDPLFSQGELVADIDQAPEWYTYSEFQQDKASDSAAGPAASPWLRVFLPQSWIESEQVGQGQGTKYGVPREQLVGGPVVLSGFEKQSVCATNRRKLVSKAAATQRSRMLSEGSVQVGGQESRSGEFLGGYEVYKPEISQLSDVNLTRDNSRNYPERPCPFPPCTPKDQRPQYPFEGVSSQQEIKTWGAGEARSTRQQEQIDIEGFGKGIQDIGKGIQEELKLLQNGNAHDILAQVVLGEENDEVKEDETMLEVVQQWMFENVTATDTVPSPTSTEELEGLLGGPTPSMSKSEDEPEEDLLQLEVNVKRVLQELPPIATGQSPMPSGQVSSHAGASDSVIVKAFETSYSPSIIEGNNSNLPLVEEVYSTRIVSPSNAAPQPSVGLDETLKNKIAYVQELLRMQEVNAEDGGNIGEIHGQQAYDRNDFLLQMGFADLQGVVTDTQKVVQGTYGGSNRQLVEQVDSFDTAQGQQLLIPFEKMLDGESLYLENQNDVLYSSTQFRQLDEKLVDQVQKQTDQVAQFDNLKTENEVETIYEQAELREELPYIFDIFQMFAGSYSDDFLGQVIDSQSIAIEQEQGSQASQDLNMESQEGSIQENSLQDQASETDVNKELQVQEAYQPDSAADTVQPISRDYAEQNVGLTEVQITHLEQPRSHTAQSQSVESQPSEQSESTLLQSEEQKAGMPIYAIIVVVAIVATFFGVAISMQAKSKRYKGKGLDNAVSSKGIASTKGFSSSKNFNKTSQSSKVLHSQTRMKPTDKLAPGDVESPRAIPHSSKTHIPSLEEEPSMYQTNRRSADVEDLSQQLTRELSFFKDMDHGLKK